MSATNHNQPRPMNARKELLNHISKHAEVKYVRVIRFHDYNIRETFEGTLDEVLPKLDFDYDSGYGTQELEGTIWYSDGTWSDRREYDGSEWWEHHECPPLPNAATIATTTLAKDALRPHDCQCGYMGVVYAVEKLPKTNTHGVVDVFNDPCTVCGVHGWEDDLNTAQVVAVNAIRELDRILATGDTYASREIVQNLKDFLRGDSSPNAGHPAPLTQDSNETNQWS
jgi:hypothetical protein